VAEPRTFKNRSVWREWLSKNHERRDEQWVVFFKKHTGKRGLTYDEAVEEAICFGWIDGMLRRRDEDTFEQRYTPRRVGGTWSESNLKRARKMIDAGAMTDSGLAMLGDALEKYEADGTVHRAPREDVLSEELMAVLKESTRAWENFEKLAPSHRRAYLGWVSDAKREATRLRRMRELAQTLATGKKLGMK
jgi:uncharacterized protein YdeI (YjbR/CyaY-like superfamily)